MRVGLLLLGVASVLVCVGAACSSFTPSDPEPVEAGIDGASTDAATAKDAAFPPTPGSIDCFGTTCSTIMGDTCCLDLDAGTKSCAKSCPAQNLPIACDEGSDCAPGQFCCVGFFGNTECSTKCGGTGERLCHTDSECEKGSSCVQVPCRGTVIGACGPVGSYVSSFCNVK